MVLSWELLLVAGSLYACAFVITIGLLIHTFLHRLDVPFSVPCVFQYCLVIFCLLRGAWLGALWCDWELVDLLVNRLALMVFLSALTLLLFTWAELLRAKYALEADSFLPSLKTPFLVINGIMYVVTLVSVVGFLATGDLAHREGSWIYNLNVLFIALSNIVISVAFAIKCPQVAYKLAQSRMSNKTLKLIIKIIVVAVVFTLCFLLRFVMLCYRPITGHYLPDVVYITTFYLVPELVPVTLQLAIYIQRVHSTLRNRHIRIRTAQQEARARRERRALEARQKKQATKQKKKPVQAPLLLHIHHPELPRSPSPS